MIEIGTAFWTNADVGRVATSALRTWHQLCTKLRCINVWSFNFVDKKEIQCVTSILCRV